MAIANADGSDPHVISFHETHEWDPAVLNDGRIIYTRWDYVDRHAVHYQQLWSVRPDGSDVRAFYGNNTLNPVGVWEARPVPGSNRVMATAAAHHAMTAGSIILLDVARGIDGLEPITRLTRRRVVSRKRILRSATGTIRPVSPNAPEVPPEEKRWPGHCYRTPYPLSEDYFLAAYSFEPLVGEPFANRRTCSESTWSIASATRSCSTGTSTSAASGRCRCGLARVRRPCPRRWRKRSRAKARSSCRTFMRAGRSCRTPRTRFKRLRIVQVLPKTTPNANTPRVGLANASPGKQVLGTVPVEPDGSAYFRAPAGIALAFQALDERGMAVQTMRSLTYLQPGEHASCVGCHEHRTTAPLARTTTLAGQRSPSTIEPGPDGSKPFSYAILVQPILDKHCVRCHCPADAQGGIDLTGGPAGEFTTSYNALAPARAVFRMEGHAASQLRTADPPGPVRRSRQQVDGPAAERPREGRAVRRGTPRLATWMDANALFYGTFDPEDQKRQQRGERIAGPALE